MEENKSPEFFNAIGRNYVVVDEKTEFIVGDIVTFIVSKDGEEPRDIEGNNLIGMIKKIEDRYITLLFSIDPVVNGVVKYIYMDRWMVVKRNGYATVSSLGKDGVLTARIPLLDVVNMPSFIVIKNMMERQK